MTETLLAARAVLGICFLVAGASKMAADRPAAEQVMDYGLLSAGQARAVGTVLPLAELGLGSVLVLGVAPRLAGLTAGVLLIGFTIAVVANLVRGNRFDCNCFGASSGPIGTPVVLRNLLLLALSLFVLLGSPLWFQVTVSSDFRSVAGPALAPTVGSTLLALSFLFLLSKTGFLLEAKRDAV